MQLTGFHHLTAMTAHIRENRRFYTEVLGLRLAKRTVNQDDVRAYHLYYTDGAGSPGTDITFFDWDIPPERRGTRSIVRTMFRVAGAEALSWWQRRLADAGLAVGEVMDWAGRPTLPFEDPEGQRLALVDDGGQGPDPVIWERSPVPPEYQLRGLGPVVLSVPDPGPTAAVLIQVLGMRRVRDLPSPEDGRHVLHVFAFGEGGPAAELHVLAQPDLPAAQPGAGGVHHVAFRTPNEREYQAWLRRLNQVGVRNSGPVDRFWFKSLYFREPGGILFEIATDGPGFAIDEPLEALGEKLALPPFLEPRRAEIEANLKPID
ncbi:ring-cleaving dioxygenase [Symbiobacterium thermophilum]|uniref:Ring-cleaving dioxygenase n=1 Tax=Symbiobacterium thermophilum TaxID=2734 RepID=A0A953IFA8_SYMTR|nr:ring-cleaving dioxygenase [Symbiobacterium thermophilum]MBY6277435.1 ring-cleaving dioxygenase [Symbiobacterium thermophilum]